MRTLSACGLALAAVLSLAACGGGGNSGSQPALGLDDIRELTGLSAPSGPGLLRTAAQGSGVLWPGARRLAECAHRPPTIGFRVPRRAASESACLRSAHLAEEPLAY